LTYVLALDQGTTSSRAILFDREGSIQGVAQKEFTQHFPKPGWVEHDPMEIWSSQVSVASEVLSRQSVPPSEVAAIGITNQRETTVLWERKTGRPLHNALVWQDRRTADYCAKMRESHGAMITEKTGLIPDAYFSASKIAWLLDNVDGARQRAEKGELAVGTIDTWLTWKLTGGNLHVTDVSNASRTMLFNLHTMDWDDELLKLFRVPREVLPEVRDSSEVYGETDSDLFGKPVPVAGMAGDQQSALFGQMCVEKGLSKNTYGTGCFMLLNIGDKPLPSKHRLLTTVAWRQNGKTQYALEGSVFIGGAVVQWLRDGLKIIETASDVEALARTEKDNGGVYLVPAFAGLGAPHWDQFARGAIVGLTRGTTSGHIARAALEGIAFQVADVLEAMQADSELELKELRVDGGACANDLLMQTQADILGLPIVRPQVTETTALGAAYLAGLAVGYWKDLSEVSSQWKAERRFEPQIGEAQRADQKAKWKRALGRAGEWENQDES
jgi:glycerol kinase